MAFLGLEELAPLAEKVFEEKRFGADVLLGREIMPITQGEFMKILKDCRETKNRLEWLKSEHLYPFEDTIGVMSDWYCFSKEYKLAQAREKQGYSRIETIQNRYCGVGRNDPCPCGSGKKYKKCCLQ